MPTRLLQEYAASSKNVMGSPSAATPSPIHQPVHPASLTSPQMRSPTAPTADPSTPFADVDVWPMMYGATVITWKQNTLFKQLLPSDTVLVLEFSYDLAPNSWILVSESPVAYYLEDTVNRYQGQTVDGFYRIRLVSSEFEHVSEPIRLFQKLTFTEYRTALRIIRAENRQIYHKSPGFLLKRKQLGTQCTACVDLLTGLSTNDQCPICYHTGFIGGYFEPIPCGMEITVKGSNHRIDPDRGSVNDKQVQGRITALYFPEQNDVWVDETTGSRYRVVGYEVICHQRSVPLVLMAVLKHIPVSDIVYKVKASRNVVASADEIQKQVVLDVIDELGGLSEGLSQSITSTISVGGIPTGTTLPSGTSTTTVFRQMLTPAQPPRVTSFTSAPAFGLREAGQTVNSFALTVNWTRGTSNVTQIRWYANDSLIETTLPGTADTSATITHAVGINNGTRVYRVDLVDANGLSVSSTGTVELIFPAIVGSVSSASPSNSELLMLDRRLVRRSDIQHTYIHEFGHFMCAAFPVAWGLPTSIRDQNNFENLSSFSNRFTATLPFGSLNGEYNVLTYFTSTSPSAAGMGMTFYF